MKDVYAMLSTHHGFGYKTKNSSSLTLFSTFMIGGGIICSEEWPGFHCCSEDTKKVASRMWSSKQNDHIRQSYQVNMIPVFFPHQQSWAHEVEVSKVYFFKEPHQGIQMWLEVLTMLFVGEEMWQFPSISCNLGEFSESTSPSADLDIAAGSTWAHFTFANGRQRLEAWGSDRIFMFVQKITPLWNAQWFQMHVDTPDICSFQTLRSHIKHIQTFGILKQLQMFPV